MVGARNGNEAKLKTMSKEQFGLDHKGKTALSSSTAGHRLAKLECSLFKVTAPTHRDRNRDACLQIEVDVLIWQELSNQGVV